MDTPSDPASVESPSQKQARIRRERREAKILAGGSSRLDKITSLSGRPADAAPPPPASLADPAVTDPDEVDISNHPYTNSRSSSHPRASEAATEAEIRRLLRGGGPVPEMQDQASGQAFGAAGSPPGQPLSQGDEDPMMRMLQQIMGGAGIQGGSGANQMGGLPPGLAAMLGGGGAGGAPGMGTGGNAMPPEQTGNVHAYVWKIVHALLALALGVYMTSVTAFSGARFSRTDPGVSGLDEVGVKFFWAFATAELVLQSSRFFLERGQVSQGVWMGFLVGMLPEPWRSRMALLSRYSGIYTTIVQDGMVVLFVLGCVAWWKGAVG